MSEALKHLNLFGKYLGRPMVDIGSGGDKVAPFAMRIESSREKMRQYRGGEEPEPSIEWHGDNLWINPPFMPETLGTVFSSHFLEDVPLDKRKQFIRVWARTLKPGGHMVLLVPEINRWRAYLKGGGIPNCSHVREFELGEIPAMVMAGNIPLQLVEERLTDQYDGDISLMCVMRAT